MKILKINPNNPEQKIIDQAVECLQNGGVLVYPTDTCYGIGTEFISEEPIKKLCKTKGRDFNKKLSIIVKDLNQLKIIANITKNQEKILNKYLPGPYTFILKQTFSTIGIRIPNYKITQMIADKFDEPYITTSANASGQPECYSIDNLLQQIKNKKNKPDLILDAGILKKNLPSTIVDLTTPTAKILRQGSGKFEN